VTPAEKLALARRSYDAFSPPDIEALIPLYHSECEWHMGPVGAALGTGVFRGHDGLRAWASELVEGFESFATRIVEARITSEGVLLVEGHNDARSRSIHMELSMSFWQEIEFRDGLVLTVVHFDQPPAGWDEATSIT
jgi:hypothetical protein